MESQEQRIMMQAIIQRLDLIARNSEKTVKLLEVVANDILQDYEYDEEETQEENESQEEIHKEIKDPEEDEFEETIELKPKEE